MRQKAPRDVTDFGKWVKKRLIDKQMTAAELAAAIGIHPAFLSRILRGDRPGTKYIELIIDQLQESRKKGA